MARSPDETDTARLRSVFSGEVGRLRSTPSHRLAEAVLLDAAHCACSGDKRTRASIESWLDEEHGERRVFSLVWCCEVWGLDENFIRARLAALLAAHGKGTRKIVKYRSRVDALNSQARIGASYQATRKPRPGKA